MLSAVLQLQSSGNYDHCRPRRFRHEHHLVDPGRDQRLSPVERHDAVAVARHLPDLEE
jgi:hypothetical protein